MIVIKDKKDCCGCHACMSVCPRNCIAMHPDEEGFLYPIVNQDVCIGCNLCEKVCPVIHQGQERPPLKVYASRNKDTRILLESSSGGVFSLLAGAVIRLGGVVFGVRFDKDWNAVHSWTDSEEGLADFRGAKYVQSRVGNTFREAESFLKQGRQVLFSGTPCQIAGLKKFLRKEYEGLLTVDIVCHGVPSPLVWQHYLASLHPDEDRITSISMRDKKEGWKRYRMEIWTGNNLLYAGKAMDNLYSKGYLADLFLRPSCHACPARKGKSGSDITIGDFWGVEASYPSFDDDKGTGLVLIHTPKGLNLYRGLDVYHIETTYGQGVKENPCLERSVPLTRFRKEFWKRFPKEGVKTIAGLCRRKKWSRWLGIFWRKP